MALASRKKQEAGSRRSGPPMGGNRFSRDVKRQHISHHSSSSSKWKGGNGPAAKESKAFSAGLTKRRQQQKHASPTQRQSDKQQQQGRQQQRQQRRLAQQRPHKDDPAASQLEQQQLQHQVHAALQQHHRKDASARLWAQRQQHKQQRQAQQQQQQGVTGAAPRISSGEASSSSSSNKAFAAAAPAFVVPSTSEAARAAAAAADALLQQEDVLRWLDRWGKGPWHAALKNTESEIMELPLPKDSSSSSSVDWAFWAAVGDRALQHVTDRLYALLRTDSEQRWILKSAGLLQQQQQQQRWRKGSAAAGKAAGEQRKGATRADEVSSLVLLTQQSPLCSSKCLLLLLRLAGSKSRSAAHAAAAQLYGLFLGPLLLPSFRKLRTMQQQPEWLIERVAALLPLLQQQLQQQHKQQQHKQQQNNGSRAAAVALLQLLLLWRFEETLAQRYNAFVMLLRTLADDHVVALSCRSLKLGAALLMRKPEREQQLLSLLVDKLGAQEGKVASCASFQLATLLRRHRDMLPVVCMYTAESLLQRLAAVLQQGRRQALEAFLSLKAAFTRSRGRLPARLKYRHRLLEQQQQRQQQQADDAATVNPAPSRSSSLSARTTARARELHRLLLRTKGSSSSSSRREGCRAIADVRVYDLLLPPKFGAGLQGVYRGLLFLSETIFREGDSAAAAHLVGVYLSVFKRLADFGVYVHSSLQESISGAKPTAAAAAGGTERQVALLPPLYLSACCNRLVRVMLVGLLRALPFLSPEAAATLLLQAPRPQQQRQQQQREGGAAHLSEVLFTLAHTLPCVASRVLAMRALHSLTVLYNHSPDRLARVVYEQLQQQHADLYAGKRAGLLLLLLGLLQQDHHDSRQAALLKRLLQTSLAHASPGVAAASLLIVEAVLQQQPQLRLLLSETETELQQSDDALKDLTDEDEETVGASKDATAAAAAAASDACFYVPSKRDPRFTRASETRLWELSVCSASYHPRVSSSASRLISLYSSSRSSSSSSSSSSSGSSSSGAADVPAVDEAALVETLRSVTASSLLDDLAYKSSQQQQQQRKQQQQQQEQRVSLNSTRYWQRHEAEPERRFIRQYFLDRVVAAGQLQQRGGRGSAKPGDKEEGEETGDESEGEGFEADEAFSDEEVDAFLEKQARQLGGGDSEEEGGEDTDDEDEVDQEADLSPYDSEGSEAGDEEEADDPLEEQEEGELSGDEEEEEGGSHGKKRKRQQSTAQDVRLRCLRRHLDKHAISGTVFADAEGIEDLLE
ncbi:hypothetical protein Esti_005415 [Eimeria stiedai]